jgi:hypothetical protein
MTRATNRRAVLGAVLAAGASAASAAGAAIPSLAPAPDPIFDLIEVHQTTLAQLVDAYDDLWGTVSDDEVTPEIEARRRELDGAYFGAEHKLLETPPTTIAGMRAIIEYLIECDRDNEPVVSINYFSTTLLRSPVFATRT